ncbi:MAG: hypothetical protein LRY75_15730 [Shewanella xiamenensis]|nr:hypothetical protein [Shewanella xiamenensis]
MEDEFVSRSRLFREGYLPGSFPQLRNKSYARVVGTSGTASSLDGLDKEQLREVIRDFINNWESNGGATDPTLMSAVEKKQLEYQSPAEIYVEIGPHVLFCTTCKVVDYFDTNENSAKRKIENDIGYKGGRVCIPCKRSGCNGNMIQIPYLGVHRCGIESTINIDPRLRFSTKKFAFIDKGSFFHSSFVEAGTNTKLDNTLQGKCAACEKQYKEEISKRGALASGGEAFVSQSVQYIALGEVRGKLVSRIVSEINSSGGILSGTTEDLAEAIGLGVLKLLPVDELERKLDEILSGETLSAAEKEKLMAKRTELMESIAKAKSQLETFPFLASIIETAVKEVEEIEVKLGGAAGYFKKAREYFPEEDTLRKLVLNRRTVESIFLPKDVQGLTVDEAILTEKDVVQREAMRNQWLFIKKQYGIDSITHIPDLRVVLAAVGYTREKNAPQVIQDAPPVTLNGFSDTLATGLAGKKPIYVLPAKTEALWIKLDPVKVLKWCIDSAGWDTPDEDDIFDSPAKSMAYLLRHSATLTLSPAIALREADKYPVEDSAPFHLLHSISHALQLTARRHSGYDSKSIQEYLVPQDLSVILYVPSVQDYTPGGLLTLFQHYLKSWFDEASMFAFSCAFDPFCSDNGGSCSGCLQTELGCETFNKGLSRAYIHGGGIDRDNTTFCKAGFWADQ